jgi:dolichyl-diphosphooligosaccharide--protein glycosyltransferase
VYSDDATDGGAVSVEPTTLFGAIRVTGGSDGASKKRTHVTDYLDSYEWLKANTAPNARVLAWWSYGYHITGIANRTALADGNTWNDEHVAAIATMLLAPPAQAHALVRHVADYVYLWVGDEGLMSSDLSKAQLYAKVAAAAYPRTLNATVEAEDEEAADPEIGCHIGGERLRDSILHRMSTHSTRRPTIAPEYFELVYTSPRDMVRIFRVSGVSEESRAWLADPANRACSPPHECHGPYPDVEPWRSLLAEIKQTRRPQSPSPAPSR